MPKTIPKMLRPIVQTCMFCDISIALKPEEQPVTVLIELRKFIANTAPELFDLILAREGFKFKDTVCEACRQELIRDPNVITFKYKMDL